MVRPLLILLAAIAICAPSVQAAAERAERTLADSERLYLQIGRQLFCTCGCRDNLLDCSHNVCTPKAQERAFLKELCRNPKFDEGEIKQEMVTRFGPEVLQAPASSLLYPLLGAAAMLMLAGFGTMLHHMVRRPTGLDEGTSVGEAEPDELDQRIAEELKEMD